ncbi:MAG: beta-lactamase family protein [Verrucomicrobia bacterium]|nr:beta-lactamase family protein [Verrucomicrobiota bacterium]
MHTPTSFLKSVCFLVSLCFALALAARELPSVAPESVGISSAKLEKVDKVIEDLIQQKKLAGTTVMIARHGKVVYSKTFGKMDLEADKPMRPDAIFRIYSMSKALTTAAALILYDEGKIKLNDPVSKYVPDFKSLKVWNGAGNVAPTHEPTIRDLMRHTAGLTYGAFGDTPVDRLYREAKVLNPNEDLKAMCEKLGKLPLLYDPGTKWVYSVAIDVLGRVIEVASGMTFDAFLQQRLLEPLDMKDTGFYVPRERADRLAAIYNSDGNGTLKPAETQTASPYLTKPKLLSGGGGMVSTTRDYMRFLQMIAQGGELQGVRVLKSETVALMTHNQLPPALIPIAISVGKRADVGFGLGFSVRVESTDDAPSGRVGEYGWGGMASTHYWTSPKDDLVVVTMEQSLPFSMMLETVVKGPIYDAITK